MGGGEGQREQQERRCSRPQGGDLPVMSRDREPTGPELTCKHCRLYFVDRFPLVPPLPALTQSEPTGSS